MVRDDVTIILFVSLCHGTVTPDYLTFTLRTVIMGQMGQ